MNNNQASNKTNLDNDFIWVGTIVNTHGVKGEVRILSSSENKETLFSKGKKIFLHKENSLIEMSIKSSRNHKNFILVLFEGYENINDIEWSKSKKIYTKKDTNLDKDEFYLKELINLDVVDKNKGKIGVVSSFVYQGAYDNLIVKLDKTNKEINIPMVEEFEVNYDEKNKLVSVNIPKEFLD